jgi:hypothetical protein
MKVLLVKVHPTHEMFEVDGGDVLVLGLKEASMGIKKLMAEAVKLKKKFKTSVTVSMWDQPTIVDYQAIEDHIGSKGKVVKIFATLGITVDHLVLDLPVNQVLALDEECESTECAEMHVDENSVWWDYFPKHTGQLFDSGRVPHKIFEKAVK